MQSVGPVFKEGQSANLCRSSLELRQTEDTCWIGAIL